MKTIVTLQAGTRKKTIIANGRPADVSDQIVRIKRAFGFRMTHSTQAVDLSKMFSLAEKSAAKLNARLDRMESRAKAMAKTN